MAERLNFGLALHVGDVLYGNIGGSNRLDFTCIGPAVNLAARLEKLTGGLGRTMLASPEFANHASDDWIDIGEFAVAGFARPQRVFGLRDESGGVLPRSLGQRIASSTSAAALNSASRAAPAAMARSSKPQVSKFQSSSTCAARQIASASRNPRISASASSAEPVSVVIECSAPTIQASAGIAARAAAMRVSGCRTCTIPSRQHEARTELVGRPAHDRIPCRALLRDQPCRAIGAVEQQIGAEVLDDVRRHLVAPFGNAVDDAVGEPRQRHARRIDGLGLRVPFPPQRIGNRRPGRASTRPRGRPHRLAVQRDREAFRNLAGRRPSVKKRLRSTGRAAWRADLVGSAGLRPRPGSNNSRIGYSAVLRCGCLCVATRILQQNQAEMTSSDMRVLY